MNTMASVGLLVGVGVVVSVAAWWVIAGNEVEAGAVVAEACTKSAAVDSFDVTSYIDYYEDGVWKNARLEIAFSGVNAHQKYYIGDEFIGESIRYGNMAYSRDGNGDWYILDVDFEGFEVPFPYNSESLCADLSGVSFMGTGKVSEDSDSVRRYVAGRVSDATGNIENAVVSINSEGWIVQVESEPSNDLRVREVFSGLGEANIITSPIVR